VLKFRFGKSKITKKIFSAKKVMEKYQISNIVGMPSISDAHVQKVSCENMICISMTKLKSFLVQHKVIV